MTRRVVSMSCLPGEPLDGTGKVCIHLFVQDTAGPFVEPHVMQVVNQELLAGPMRGRLACDPKRQVAPVTRNSVTTVTCRTDDPRAVTCHKCKQSKDYTDATAKLTK